MTKHTNDTDFEPKIVAFLCNWCSYRGADLAGTSRFQYPENIRTIRVMCSGAVDPAYVLKALLSGADGVLVSGCLPGDCHYQSGNYKAKRRMDIMKSVLKTAGIDEDRVWLRWISASDGTLFRDTVKEMVTAIKAKGPNPMQAPWNIWQTVQGPWKPQKIRATRGE